MRFSFLLVTLALFLVQCAPSQKYDKRSSRLIPNPNAIALTDESLTIQNPTISFNAPSCEGLVAGFITDLAEMSGVKGKIADSDADIVFELAKPKTEAPASSYQMEINDGGVRITASSVEGLFYGGRSLLLLVEQGENGKGILPQGSIQDQPRYDWRGLMLDESRHFFGKEKVKQILDMMALHKLNKFHWHLTDEPAWRLEILKYPKLSTVGGKGSYCFPQDSAKFYTQADIKEILDYASDRFIDVIPEIDMPGHATAANRAYPEYSGGGSKNYPDFTFNPGDEATYAYLEDILSETASLFKSPYLHYGGDEVHFGNHEWKTDPQVKALMKKENLKSLKEVEQYFNRRMAKYIDTLGKTTMGWDEIINAGVPPENAVVMWWRHDRPKDLATALDKGYKTILCPRVPLYFDFVQHDSHKLGRRWNGFGDLQGVYEYPVFPEETKGMDMNLVMGIQGNIWTERIQNNQRLDFMTFPRLSALAEAAWTEKENKDYDSFQTRLKSMLPYFKSQGIQYFDPFDPASTPEPEDCSRP